MQKQCTTGKERRVDRRRFPTDDYRKKLEFLRNDPVTRRMDAVKHGRITEVVFSELLLHIDAAKAHRFSWK
jgi:hypothetical protein